MRGLMKSRRSCHSLVLLVLVLIGFSGCGGETRVTRVDSGVVTDLSGRWNDTDSRMVAESMVKEALEYPWLNNFSQSKRRQPVVVVGTVMNNSHEHINVQTFVRHPPFLCPSRFAPVQEPSSADRPPGALQMGSL